MTCPKCGYVDTIVGFGPNLQSIPRNLCIGMIRPIDMPPIMAMIQSENRLDRMGPHLPIIPIYLDEWPQPRAFGRIAETVEPIIPWVNEDQVKIGHPKRKRKKRRKTYGRAK